MSALIRISAVGLAAFVLAVTALHFVDPVFGISDRTLSEFIHGEVPALLIAGLLAWSASLAAMGGSILVAVGQHRSNPAVVALAAGVFLAAAGLVLVAAFPTDRGAETAAEVTLTTTGGRLHDLGSAAATAGILVAAVAGAVRMPGLRAPTVWLLGAAVVGSASLLAIGDPAPGLRQRLLVLVACAWQMACLLTLGSGAGHADRSTTWGRSSAGSRGSTS